MTAPLDRLPTLDADGNYHVVVEAAAGSRNKFKFEPGLGALVLHAMLPLGTSFPYAFGFIPSTLGEDGDALDALLFIDETVPPGTVVPCRLVGAIRARQSEKGKAVRNDRLLAVAVKSHVYRRCENLQDLDRRTLEEIEAFFVFYNAQKGKDFEPLSRAGRAQAARLVKAGQRAFAHKA
jgi:inorganic pyrophosphatase